MVQVTWPIAMPIYGKNLKRSFFSGTKRPMTLKLGMQHQVLDLDLFYGRSNSVPYAFVWKKGKTMDFSETIQVYDIKVGRCSQQN